MAIWYILPSFGILYQQKSGNLDKNAAFPWQSFLNSLDFFG
jgi:hypothetical protein